LLSIVFGSKHLWARNCKICFIEGKTMRTTLYAVLGLGIAGVTLGAADRPPITAQGERGRELFLHSAKGTACATCHQMAGLGTAIAPDLSVMASMATVHSLVAIMRMTMTNTVLLVKTPTDSFPAVLKETQGDESQFWDLSKMPPVLRKLTSKEVVSTQRDTKWRHPPSTAEYTPQEFADVISFLQWAATGSQKEVKVSDIGELQ
jgi:mono/diheme cytochrome c family protein